jgi:hypothetical protein
LVNHLYFMQTMSRRIVIATVPILGQYPGVGL